ncbi:MAG: PIN domain-containing protein [Burkholderiales bacterium]|nr:MAG: PIN domain-containing protein [Burkholderiales bacterium]TAG77640.1 MAG: PIN domain-containing protein [Betaproteobacteria bacterium]
MHDKVFADSNVLLYLLSGNDSKAETVESLLRNSLTISVQVLNEIVSVARRKYQLSWPTVNEFVLTIKALCDVVPLTEQIHDTARFYAERYTLSFYDACIVAAAIEAHSNVLLSEDMHVGLVIDKRLRIVNPFA